MSGGARTSTGVPSANELLDPGVLGDRLVPLGDEGVEVGRDHEEVLLPLLLVRARKVEDLRLQLIDDFLLRRDLLLLFVDLCAEFLLLYGEVGEGGGGSRGGSHSLHVGQGGGEEGCRLRCVGIGPGCRHWKRSR